jgi:hypothetical protein
MNNPLSVILAQPDQVARLARFRRAHPDVVIGLHDGWRFWRAVIPEDGGEQVITHYQLRALLDALDDMIAQ